MRRPLWASCAAPRKPSASNNPTSKSMYLIVEPVKDPTTPAALSLSLYVSSDYGGGYLVFAGDGTIKHVSYPS